MSSLINHLKKVLLNDPRTEFKFVYGETFDGHIVTAEDIDVLFYECFDASKFVESLSTKEDENGDMKISYTLFRK